MLSVAIAVALLSIPITAILWFRWKADRKSQTVKDASVRAMVDETLDRAKAEREKTATVSKEMGT